MEKQSLYQLLNNQRGVSAVIIAICLIMLVGFIALAGVSAETAVIMLLYLNHSWDDRIRAGRRDLAALYEAVMEGAVHRVRPKVMTVTAIIGGLLPILWGHGTGAGVMKRIAAPMVGGMLSATVLTLVVVPVIYFIWQGVAVSKGRVGSPREVAIE